MTKQNICFNLFLPQRFLASALKMATTTALHSVSAKKNQYRKTTNHSYLRSEGTITTTPNMFGHYLTRMTRTDWSQTELLLK